VENQIFGCMCGFAFLSCISIAGSNVFLGLASLMTFYRLYIKRDDLYIKSYLTIFKVIGIFLTSMLLSVIFSVDMIVGINRLLEAYVYRMFPFFIIICCIKDFKKILILGGFFLLSLAIVDSYAIWQGLNGNFRANGFFASAMSLGGVLAMMIPVLVVLVADHIALKKYYKSFVFLLIISVLALLFNGTRGSWGAIVLLVPILSLPLIKNLKKAGVIFLTSITLLTILFAFVPQLKGRIDTLTNTNYQSNTERLLLWKSAIHMLQDNPIFGVGLGRYTYEYQTNYILPEAKERGLGHAHNNFLQMLGEAGFVGIIGFCSMMGYFLYFGIYKWRKNKNIYALMFLGITLGLLLQGLTEFNFGNSAVIKLYWGLSAVCIQSILLNERMLNK